MNAEPLKARTWSVTYLLPYVSNPSAVPDKKAKGHFRHREIVTATTQREVVHDLIVRKAVPIEVKEVKPANPFFAGRMAKAFRQQFLISLIFSVDGGMSPGQALEDAITSETGVMRQRLNLGLNALRQGRSFLDALRAIDLYDTTTMAIIEAGEETGTLRQALKTAEEHLNKGNEARKVIVMSIAWTAIDLVFAVSGIIGTRTGMIPYLRGQHNDNPKEAAAMAHALDQAQMANDFLIALSLVVVFALFAGMIGYFGNNERLRQRIDELLLKTPIVRDLIANTAISGTCGVMSSLLRGGVNFIPATTIAERGTRMMTVIRYWRDARSRVEAGEPPGQAISMPPFTDTEKMILRSHRDSAQLAHAFDVIGKQRDEKAKAASRRFARVTFIGSMVYSMLGVLLVLWVVYLQSESATNLSFAPQ